MTNAEKFQEIFKKFATEVWAFPEKDFLTWLNAEYEEPRKGHWIDTDEWRETVDGFEQWGYFRKCSKCGYVFKFLEIDNYCPNCGAKMESEGT